ncbi:MAG: purine-nucleoside/S-methyl-5-thioadenosine phosphorylase / adenosine deaminase [Gaiellaceae bacterium]|nr:purine-nucleoside/S-methyl-5-thioadenosine phosphorylase / adenosine deaminase [Gaiellaceae bacterium]
MIRWQIGGYVVGFTTRQGGVSDGPYASLNLGVLTRDDPQRAAENRRIACARLGADIGRLAHNHQVHGTRVVRATPGQRGERADGLWTDEPGVPLLVMSADCLPIVLVRRHGTAAIAVLHAGWKGLLGGIVASGVAAIRGGTIAAAIGPAIGPCCYEVGEEVAAPYRERFGDDVMQGKNLDLWTSAERALRSAGVAHVHRFDRCTSCEPDAFFSHRRDNGDTGRQGVIAYVAL